MPGPANPRYTRLHHAYWLTPGLDGLTPRGETTWTRALAYADQNLTDGYVSRAGLKMIGRTPRDAAVLVSVGLWSKTEDGWQINDYDQWATPSAKISKQRAGNAQRQARYRARNALRENENRPDTERVSSDLRHDTGMTSAQSGTSSTHDSATHVGIHAGQDTAPEDSNALRNALRNGHQPDQTRPDSGGVVSNRYWEDENSAADDGADAPGMDRSPAPPDRCEAHAHIPPGHPVPACHACRDARLAHDHDTTRAAAARRAELDACVWCDTNGWRLMDGPAVRCDHTPPTTTTPPTDSAPQTNKNRAPAA